MYYKIKFSKVNQQQCGILSKILVKLKVTKKQLKLHNYDLIFCIILRFPPSLMPIDDWCSEKNNSNYLDPICALLLRRKNDRWDTVKDLKSLNEVK